MTIVMPLSFYTIITGVGACVMTGLQSTIAGVPSDFRYVPHTPGQIAWDDCECGMLIQTAGPTLWSDDGVTPKQLSDHQNNCGPFYVGMDVNTLILRCAPQPPDGSVAPTPDALDDASRIWHSDAAAVRRSVICCLTDLLAANTVEDFQVTAQTPQGPDGLCVGSQLTWRVWLPNPDCDC